MHGSSAMTTSFIADVERFIHAHPGLTTANLIGVAVAFPWLLPAKQQARRLQIMAQSCDFREPGAVTGAVSCAMLRDLEIEYCLVGHSERRQFFHENKETVHNILKQTLAKEIRPILCFGEPADVRAQGTAQVFVGRQIASALKQLPPLSLAKIIFAYEPIWAIGTGKVASVEDVKAMLTYVRSFLQENYGRAMAKDALLLYGGSVSVTVIKQFKTCPNLNGFLVGGASLQSTTFLDLLRSFCLT